MSKRKDLVMVAIVTVVAIGVVLSASAIVRGAIRALRLVAESLGG